VHLTARQRFEHAFSPEDRLAVPCYAALTDAMALNAQSCELLDAAPERQQNPMLLLAALHLAALRGHPVLTPLYDQLDNGQLVDPTGFASRVLSVVHSEPDLIRNELHRSTQTNEINRSAIIATVLHELGTRGFNHISLIDLGCSMGLNLYPDYQHYAITDDGRDGTIVSELRNPASAWSPLPTIAQRVGIDQQPLDPTNADDVLWLRACLWPEQRRRTKRLVAALESEPSWPRATRHTGSALDLVQRTIDACPPDSTPVVMHCWMAAYLTTDEQRALRETLMSSGRPVVWIALEHPVLVQGLEPPPKPDELDASHAGATAIMVALPGSDLAWWGTAHPHGRWVSLDVSGPNADRSR
jgi:hypothetical protein